MSKKRPIAFRERVHRSAGCATCRDFPDLLATIDKLAELVREGKTSRSIAAIHRYLRDPENGIGYTLEITAFRNHIRNCTG